MNLNGNYEKTGGGKAGDQAKIWGAMAHPGPLLESPLSVLLWRFVVRTVAMTFGLAIDRYCFFCAGTDISAVHGPIANTDFQNFKILFSASLLNI